MAKKTQNKEIDELKSGWLRTQADFDNYKKRIEQDKQTWNDAAKIEVFGSLLPVLDNLSLMTNHVPKELETNSWVQGVALITKQIDQKMTELGIERIDPKVGDEFDFNLHEAISTGSSEEIAQNHILKVEKPGYKLGSKLIRPAQVIVSK